MVTEVVYTFHARVFVIVNDVIFYEFYTIESVL